MTKLIAVLVDAGLNLVRLHEHVSITPTGADISDYSRNFICFWRNSV